jgi:tRNA (guanine26-N2/guanine27-N2)-dimethyltransferase
MAGPAADISKIETTLEGKTQLFVKFSGGTKGPGTRGGVFFNPAMVQNRDLSMVLLQYLSDNNLLPGKNKRVLDGLCGSGARAVRLAVETSLIHDGVGILGTDINPSSIELAVNNSMQNRVEVKFFNRDLNEFLVKERFSYIDIDPFGSPVQFLRSAICGVLNGGYLGVTATDTAALTGSVPRVARRRYGVENFMTHAYQELACRSLLGCIARTAAAFERGIEPLLFYTSDHFIRGYVKVRKGAKRADSTLDDVGWLRVDRPGPPVSNYLSAGEIENGEGGVIGPVWIGELEDPEICQGMNEMLKDAEKWGYLSTNSQLRTMMDRCSSEHGLPMLGYDVNELSSHLKVSPPSLETIFKELKMNGRTVSRSHFSPTIFKTDAEWDEVKGIFLRGGK